MATKRTAVKAAVTAPPTRRAVIVDALQDAHAVGAAKIAASGENHPELDSLKQEMVTVTVPKAFRLTRYDHKVELITPGIQEMELWKAEHWFSKANGVQIYAGQKK